MTRLRFSVRLNPSKSEAGDLAAFGDVTFAPMEALAGGLGGLDISLERSAVELAASNYSYFAEGDLLIAKVTPCFENGKKALVRGLPNRIGFATSEVHVVRPDRRRVDPEYLRYLLSSEPFRAAGMASMTGAGGLRRISDNAIKDFDLPIADLLVQERVARFLSRETSRVDRLISRKERQVDALAEREEATFLGVVTGRDKSGPREDSGVDWIGTLPSHWQAPKFTHVARLESGHTPSRTEDTYWLPEECVIPWVSLSDVWQIRNGGQVYIEETAEKISQIGMDNSAARLLPAGTVVLSRTASVGFAAILAAPMATTQDFAAWICGTRVRPTYLYYVLRSMKPVFRKLMMGSTHQTIYMPDIRSFRLPLPPVDEQDEIVRHLNRVTGGFRAAAAKITASVERLREYRSALIAEAVTGQSPVAEQTAGKIGEPDAPTWRLLVSAEIVHRHRATARFGRVKHQKLLYLAETHVGIVELEGRYRRMAAGPLDQAMMDEAERGMEAAGFYRAAQATPQGNGVGYVALPKAGSHRDDLVRLLGDREARLAELIGLLHDFDTRAVEAIATLYAVWNDALIDREHPDDNSIIKAVLDDWHPEKRDKFRDSDLRHWLAWMKRNRFTPSGSGPRTVSNLPRDMFA